MSLLGAISAARRRSGSGPNTPWRWTDPNPLSTHRYWRLYMTNGFTISELYFRDLNGTLLTPTWSANNTGNGAAANVADGNTATFWGSSFSATTGTPNWLVADLGAVGAAVVDQIELTARPSFQSQMPTSWILQFSDDNATWFNATNYNTCDPWGSGQRKVFTVRPYIVQFYWDDPLNGGFTTVSELEIKNSVSGNITSPPNTSDAVNGSYFGPNDGNGPSLAFDRVFGSNYTGNAGNPAFTEYRFPTQPSIDSVTVTSRTSFQSQAPRSFKLRISRDGFTYSTVIQTTAVTYASNETKTFVRTAPTFTTNPTITGDSSTYGNPLTCNPGVQTMGPNLTYTFQWYNNGVAISGATSAIYAPPSTYLNKALTCTVTATNEIGFATASATVFIGGQYARYWRVRDYGGSYLTNIACAELELRAASGGTDQTGDKGTFSGSELLTGLTPTLGTGVTYSGTTATCSSATSIVYFTGVLTVGLTYRFRLNYSMTSGSKLRIGNSNTNGSNIVYTSPVLSGSGSLDITFVATNTYLSVEADTANYTGTVSGMLCEQTQSITASATLSGFPASQAIDDNAATYWSSGRATPTGPPVGDYLTVDFLTTNAAKVQEFTYQVRSDSTREDPKALVLEYSPDNTTWTPYWDTGPQAAWTAGEKRTFTFGVPFGSVVITGNPTTGSTLTANTSAIYNATTLTYQWTRDGANISGATSSTYVTVSGDFGHTIACVITGTNFWGTQTFSPTGIAMSNVQVRAAGFQNINSSSTGTINLTTAGAQIGDRMVIMGGNAWAYSSVSSSGWTVVNNDSGSGFNGMVIHKVLDSGDITAGSITVTFASSYDGSLGYFITVGNSNAIRYIQGNRDASGAATLTKTSDATPLTGDLAFIFGCCRGVHPVTCANTTTEGTGTQTDGAGGSFLAVPTVNGAFSRTLAFSGGSGTAYTGMVIIAHS